MRPGVLLHPIVSDVPIDTAAYGISILRARGREDLFAVGRAIMKDTGWIKVVAYTREADVGNLDAELRSGSLFGLYL